MSLHFSLPLQLQNKWKNSLRKKLHWKKNRMRKVNVFVSEMRARHQFFALFLVAMLCRNISSVPPSSFLFIETYKKKFTTEVNNNAQAIQSRSYLCNNCRNFVVKTQLLVDLTKSDPIQHVWILPTLLWGPKKWC